MKKLTKIQTELFLGTSLLTNTIFFSSCKNQNLIKPIQETSIEQQAEQCNFAFIKENLGGENSYYHICKIENSDVKDQTQINNQFKPYLADLVSELESLLIDEKTKKYFNRNLQNLNQVYYSNSLNQTIETIYNNACANFFVGLIRATPLTDDKTGLAKREQLCYLLEIMLNEAYGKAIPNSTDEISRKYNATIDHAAKYLIKYLPNIEQDIKNNNCAEVIQLYKQLSNEAITYINSNMGTQITEKQVAQMFNITSTAKSLKALQDATLTQNQQKANLKLFYKLENAIPSEWNLLEFSNSEAFELER